MDIKDLVEVDATAMHVMRVDLEVPGHTGDAHSAIRYVRNAYRAEPLFVIRGRDALAIPVLAAYEDECARHGLYDMSSQVAKHAERFREWQRGWSELTKLPDPHPSWPKTDDAEIPCHVPLSSVRLPDPPAGFVWELGGWMGGTPQRPWPNLVPVLGDG